MNSAGSQGHVGSGFDTSGTCYQGDLAEVLVVSARARNESRGGHFREDFPHRDDVNFMRHTMAYKEGRNLLSDIRLDYKPVVQTRYEPMERKY